MRGRLRLFNKDEQTHHRLYNFYSTCVAIALATAVLFYAEKIPHGLRHLGFDDQSEAAKALSLERQATEVLSQLHRDMCSDEWKNAKPLKYDDCNPKEKVNNIPFMGGLTNALKMILLGTIGSYEEGRCFVVDESKSDLNHPDENGEKHGFIHKYMEPIGLPLDHPLVKKAQEEDRFVDRGWSEFWKGMHVRRAYGTRTWLPYAGYNDIEGHALKRSMIRRMWRPLPEYRKSSCSGMADTHGLTPGAYMAFSVRRGDKKAIEDVDFTDLDEYIIEAEKHFDRFPSQPKIFVATDDCTVLSSFREMRSNWTFVSECDLEQNKEAAGQEGFALDDVKEWSEEAEKAHFTKFFTEIYALTFSKVYVGVSYTNLAWWVFFLRPFRHSFILIDKPANYEDQDVFNWW